MMGSECAKSMDINQYEQNILWCWTETERRPVERPQVFKQILCLYDWMSIQDSDVKAAYPNYIFWKPILMFCYAKNLW